MSTHLGRWQVAALRGLMDAERDMDAADVLVTEMGERLSYADDRLRRDAESLLRGSTMGKHNTGIQSPRDFRATSGRTARDAYEFMLARRREDRHADFLLTLVPRH